MDHIKILKRAWHILWSYRTLWVFGIILALVTASAMPGGPGGGGGQAEYKLDEEEIPFPLPEGGFPTPEISPQLVGTIIAVGVGLALVILLLIVLTTVARHVARTALIRMVDDYEETGEKRRIRQGFRLGWSRAAWRLFLIELVINIPLTFVFLLLILLLGGIVALSVLMIQRISVALGVLGIIGAIGLFFLIVLLGILAGAVVRPLKRFFRRACALEGLGVIASIRRGFGLAVRHLGDTIVMWLIMIGVSIGWAIAKVILLILLLPVIILLIIVGVVLGGIPALLVGGLASLFLEGAAPWILAGLIGLPIFILVLAVPWLFLEGLMEVFKSSVWTLTYRELRALESVAPGLDAEPALSEPEPDSSGLVAAPAPELE